MRREQEYVIQFGNNDKNEIVLMEGLECSLVIKCKSKKAIEYFPENLLESLKKSVELTYNKIMKPLSSSNDSHILQLFWANLDYSKNPDALLKEIAQKYMNIEEVKIAHIDHNPFEQDNYLCYTHNLIDAKESPQLIKFIRKYTFIDVPHLMK